MNQAEPQAIAVPLVEEQVHIGRREVETDRVRVRTVVEERPVVLEVLLHQQDLEVERHPVEFEVAEAPSPREEDGCLVLSVVEERAVIQKKLFVVEEVRIRQRAFDESVRLPTTLRATRAVVERPDMQDQTKDMPRE